MNTKELIFATEQRATSVVKEYGLFNGVAFECYPFIPDIFSSHLDFDGIAYDVDFLKVETSNSGLVCCFIDKEDDTFFLPLRSVLYSEPMLYSAIISYLYGLIKR